MAATDYPCLIEDVANYLPQGVSISDSSWPTTAAVESYITNVCDEINAVLEDRGYATPLDPSLTKALSFLNTVNIYGALAAWAAAKYPADVGPGGGQGLVKHYTDKYEELKKDLETRNLGLPDDSRANAISGFEGTSRPYVRRRTVY